VPYVLIKERITGKFYKTDSEGKLWIDFPKDRHWFGYESYKEGYVRWLPGLIERKKDHETVYDTIHLFERIRPVLAIDFNASLIGKTMSEIRDLFQLEYWEYNAMGHPTGIVSEICLETDDSVAISLVTGYHNLTTVNGIDERDDAILSLKIEEVILNYSNCTQICYPYHKEKVTTWCTNPYCSETKDH